MNLFAHVTPTDVPLWIVILAAGFVLGATAALAVVGWFRRKE